MRTIEEANDMHTSPRPFHVDPPCEQLSPNYPDADTLRAVLGACSVRGRRLIAGLWLTEGAPHAFSTCPALYQEVRTWLATRLEVDPKDVTLVGSARVGYSLAGKKNFGRPFGENSDLDLAIVSTKCFGELVQDFQRFEIDLAEKTVKPRNGNEERYWPENVTVCSRNIPKGFLDSNKIPNLPRYFMTQRLNASIWPLLQKLRVTPGAPTVNKASIRVYRDWCSLVERLALNLCWAIQVTPAA